MNLSTTWFPSEIKYEALPEELRPGMKRYIEQGIQPGGFLCAVIRNDFAAAACHASATTIYRFRDIATFMYSNMPIGSWGSNEALQSWKFQGGIVGR